jgi:N12 class adenine-specific DNA methylase
MNKEQIVLTEQDLHMLVEDAVKLYLQENNMEEGVWGGFGALGSKFGNAASRAGKNMTNAASGMMNKAKNVGQKAMNAVGNAANKAGQAVGNAYNNAKQTYQVGSINQDAQKAIGDATQALSNLVQLSNKLQGMGQNPVIGRNTMPIIQNCMKTLNQISGRFAGRRTMAVS